MIERHEYDNDAPEWAKPALLAPSEPEPYTPKRGDRYEIQGRLFIVDRVEPDYDSISLRDVTFESNTGFPIFRSESLDFIRMYEPIRPEPQPVQPEPIPETLTPSWEKPKPRARTQTFDAFPGVPMSERNNFTITDNDLGVGGAKTKYRYNVEAMVLSYDSYAKEYRITLQGTLTHTVKLGTDIFGNITRLDNALEGFADRLRDCENQLVSVQTQLEAAKNEVDRPFPQEQEYTEKSERLKELNILLNMDEKDHELLDVEPDESDSADTPERVPREHDRER